MMYVSQTIILYTLNLYSAICQLYLKLNWGEKPLTVKMECKKKKIIFLFLR